MSKTKEEILNDNGAGGYVTDNRYRQLFGHREKLYKAMDEYAKQEAIEFAEYIKKNWSISKGAYRHRGDFYHNDKQRYSIPQLYQLFINSKTK